MHKLLEQGFDLGITLLILSPVTLLFLNLFKDMHHLGA